jgi:uncharacterized repeat protein (TIGR01451 family)
MTIRLHTRSRDQQPLVRTNLDRTFHLLQAAVAVFVASCLGCTLPNAMVPSTKSVSSAAKARMAPQASDLATAERNTKERSLSVPSGDGSPVSYNALASYQNAQGGQIAIENVNPHLMMSGAPASMHSAPVVQYSSGPNGADATHGHGSHEASCGCCNRGQAYRPLFPHRFGGLLACKSGCPTPHEGPCPEQACGPECEPQGRCVDPQEYIFDGGDHDPPVRLREDLSQTGLDPEDTVIQYTTKGGVTEVQAGCRVAIYSPRFGSVRKRTGTLQSDLALRPHTADLPTGPGTIKDKLPPIQVMVPVKANTKDTVRVVEAFRDRQRPLPSELVLPMAVVSDAFKPYEDLDIIRNGNIKTTDPAKLAMASAAARIWGNIEALQVLIDGQEAVEIVDLKQPREYTLYELKGARVRICKVASEQVANPGDTVSFTIRYDNIGEQPVSKLVITDSLAPRLEYVDATQQSSLPARFTTTPNDVGSAVLRWEIDQEVKPGEGGFVRFDAKVR